MNTDKLAVHIIVKQSVEETKIHKSVYDYFKRITATDEATEEDYLRMAEAKERWKNKGVLTEQQFTENKIQEIII